MHQSLQGHTRGCPAQSPEPKPRPPARPAAQCRARMAAGDPSHRELCIWRHSWPSPWGTCGAASGLLPSLLPFSHSPSRGSDSQIRSWENTHHLGFIWGWALQVQAQFVPGQEESGPLRSPGTSGLCRSPPHIPAHTTSLPPSLLPESLIPSPAGRCGAEPRARWLTPRRHTRRTAVSPACLCW